MKYLAYSRRYNNEPPDLLNWSSRYVKVNTFRKTQPGSARKPRTANACADLASAGLWAEPWQIVACLRDQN